MAKATAYILCLRWIRTTTHKWQHLRSQDKNTRNVWHGAWNIWGLELSRGWSKVEILVWVLAMGLHHLFVASAFVQREPESLQVKSNGRLFWENYPCRSLRCISGRHCIENRIVYIFHDNSTLKFEICFYRTWKHVLRWLPNVHCKIEHK